MPRVFLSGRLKRLAAAEPEDVTGANLQTVLDEVFARQPILKNYVIDDHGRLRRNIAVFIDGQRLSITGDMSVSVEAHSEIHLFQALSGG